MAWARQWFLERCCQPAHEQIKDALTEAGFNVRRIERFDCHDRWEVRMQRGTDPLAPQPRVAARQLRRILADAGVYVEADAIVVEQNRGRILLGFICADGEEGVWDYPRSDA